MWHKLLQQSLQSQSLMVCHYCHTIAYAYFDCFTDGLCSKCPHLAAAQQFFVVLAACIV